MAMGHEIERIDRLFELALVLLSILAATEFQFVTAVPERKAEIPYAFRVLTYPIVILIASWLLKETMFQWQPGHVNFKMAFREFCWDLWASTLFIYLALYLLFAFGYVNLTALILFAGLTGVLASIVSITYQKAEPEMVYFRNRRKRILRSLFIFGLAYVVGFVLFLP